MAQLDNAADSDSEERGFESLRAGQKIDKLRLVDFFIRCESDGISSAVRLYIIKGGITALVSPHTFRCVSKNLSQ